MNYFIYCKKKHSNRYTFLKSSWWTQVLLWPKDALCALDRGVDSLRFTACVLSANILAVNWPTEIRLHGIKP